MASNDAARRSVRSMVQILAFVAVLNALAAIAAYICCGLASGISQAVAMGSWSMLEHSRVLVLDPPPVVEGVKDVSMWGLYEYVTSGIVEALLATKWVACIIPALNAVILAIIAARYRWMARPDPACHAGPG